MMAVSLLMVRVGIVVVVSCVFSISVRLVVMCVVSVVCDWCYGGC